MLKVIWGDNDTLIKEISKQFNGAYSAELESLLVTDEEYLKIENVYHFESDDYDHDNDETGRVTTDSISDYLEMIWEETEIEISMTFTYPEKISIQLVNDVEIALEPYVTKGYPDQEKNLNELFSSVDWYQEIYKYVQEIMLTLVLDTTKSEINNMINRIREGIEA